MKLGPAISRRTLLAWFAPATGFALAARPRSESIDLRLESDELRVVPREFRFLSGGPLERLQNGAPVPFAIQFSLFTDRMSAPLHRDIQRFVISYDLWEERFAVAKLGPRRKTALCPTAAAAETWCLEEMTLRPTGLTDQQEFWVRLEVRAEDQRGTDAGDDPMSLGRLIELFSRRARKEDRRWDIEAGPFRLADLRRGVQRGGARFPAPRAQL